MNVSERIVPRAGPQCRHDLFILWPSLELDTVVGLIIGCEDELHVSYQ